MPVSGSIPGAPRLPLPAALLIFAGVHGEARAIAVGWVGVVSTAPPLLMLQFGGGTGIAELPAAGESFAVALPGKGLPREGGGLAPPTEDVAWPVRIECRCRFLESRFGQYRIGGEVLAITRKGRRRELPAPVVFGILTSPTAALVGGDDLDNMDRRRDN